jgi:hypothetical protein
MDASGITTILDEPEGIAYIVVGYSLECSFVTCGNRLLDDGRFGVPPRVINVITLFTRNVTMATNLLSGNAATVPTNQFVMTLSITQYKQ